MLRSTSVDDHLDDAHHDCAHHGGAVLLDRTAGFIAVHLARVIR